MRTLLSRLCGVAVLAFAVTACVESPTVPLAAPPSAPPASKALGSGGDLPGDTLTTTNITAGDTDATRSTCTTTERGGHMMGGGYLVEPGPCSP